jgi:hypothetical protein
VAAGRSVALGVARRLCLLGAAALALLAAAAKSPEPRRIALRLSDGFEPGPAAERFLGLAKSRGIEVQSSSESTAAPKGWEVVHLAKLPVPERLKPALARFPASFEASGFAFDGRTYAGRDDAIFLADPGRPAEIFVLGVSEQAVLDLATRRLLDRPEKPADYEVLSGELTKEGRFVEKDGRFAIDPASGLDLIAGRDEFYKSLRREKRGGLDWEYPAAQAAAVARWEKAAARFAGKRPFSVRIFPDAVLKALYTGSSRPADLVADGGKVRVEIDASAPEEPDLVSPVLAAAALGAGNPVLLERRTLLYAAGARRFGKWWGRDARSFSAFAHAAGVEPSVEEVVKSDPDVSPVLAVGAAAAWLDAGSRLESEAAVEKSLGEAEAALSAKLSRWREAAWRQSVKPPARRTLPEGFLRGIACAMSDSIEGAYIAPSSLATLKRLRELGANSVSVIPYGYAREAAGDRILFVHRSPRGETDEGIVRALFDARSLGMTALVQPRLWVGRGAAVGDIAMADDRSWRGWFDSYRRFIVHQAVVAEASGVALFCVGSDLQKTEPREKDWRDVVAAVRLATGAPVLYAADGAANANRITFWETLDAIGVDFFDSLSKSEKLSDSALDEAVRRAARPVAELSERAGKSVIFTEVGYPAVRSAWIAPRDEAQRRPAGAEDAARAIAAVSRALAKESWWKGVYWWKAFSDGKLAAPGERGFHILGTPAEKAIEQGFRQRAGS